MMEVPVKITTDDNSKIFMIVDGGNGVISNITWCRSSVVKWYMSILLLELKDKWDEILQEAKLSRRSWRCCWSTGDLICLKHLVSLVKSSALLQWMASGRSFMYNMIRSGPRMLLLIIQEGGMIQCCWLIQTEICLSGIL